MAQYGEFSGSERAEVCMAKKKGKSVSFDAMVKFFMNTYNIPTKRDIERLNTRLDHIERLMTNFAANKNRRSATAKSSDRQNAATASDVVFELIQRYEKGIGIGEIKIQTGFGEKKLRNIIFRLHKMGKIKRLNRGIYTIA